MLVATSVLIAMIFLLRWLLRVFAPERGGKNRHLTFVVKVPKYSSKGDKEKDARQQDVKEAVGVTETFFAAIGGLRAERSFSAWLFGRTDDIALELVAHEKKILFYLTVPAYLQEFVEQQLHAQEPDASIEPVADFNLFSPTGVTVGGYLRTQREAALPIKTYKELESDSLNAITNAMAKVGEGEGVAIQYMLRSAKKSWRSTGLSLVKRMREGMSYSEAKKASRFFGANPKRKEGAVAPKPTKTDEKMQEGIEEKLRKAGLDVNIRIVASAPSAIAAEAIMSGVFQSFSQFNIYEYGNAFKKAIPRNKKSIDDFIHRRFSEKYLFVLNTEELASLWHLPLPSTETPTIEWLDARIAPAPTTLASKGLHLGYNLYRGQKTEVYIDDEDRRRHLYIIGKTGSGKSYFLRYMAVQDIKAGKGVCVIDPHGDLVDSIMGLIPPERIDDVVYFDPSDTERPMGLNMLEAPNESMRDFAVQEMIAIFQMLFPPEMIGPMFEHNMRNFMLTLMADLDNPGTLAEIPRMISDDAFQKKWVEKVKDPAVRGFWEQEMAKTSDYHKSEMMGYLVSKVGRFVENEMMRNIVGQASSAFDFRKIMDEKKILLVNLSKGRTGEVNANLLGLILVAKLQMAAFTRADIPEEDRNDFMLYIDEFQNFITPSIATILSEARKYRLNLVLAHQYMGQLVKDGKAEIRDAVLGNVGSMLVARVGPEDTEVLGKVFEPTFTPYDLMNTDKYTWNAKIITGNAQTKPFTLKAVPPPKPNEQLAKTLKEVSRLTYGRSKTEVERDIAVRSGIGA